MRVSHQLHQSSRAMHTQQMFQSSTSREVEAVRVPHKSFNLVFSADIVFFIYTSEGNLPAGTDNFASSQTEIDPPPELS